MSTEHKNILLVVNDDLAAWALGAYGNREAHTPTIDCLAATGVVMQNAFTPTPVCSPARACLLTGRLASQHGIHDYLSSTIESIHRRDWLADEVTLAQLLADAGYQTAHCGKWHLGNDDQPQAGFQQWFSGFGDYPAEHGGEHRWSVDGDITTLPGQRTQVITDRAVDFLRGRDTDAPFFLHIGYFGTHNPWRGQPERLAAQFAAANSPVCSTSLPIPSASRRWNRLCHARKSPRGAGAVLRRCEPHRRSAGAAAGRAGGAGAARRHADRLHIRSWLELRAAWTVGKGNATLPLNMLEESIRVPLIFNQPRDLFAGQRRVEGVDHLDVFQTIANYAGMAGRLDASRRYPGRSFLPLLDNSGALADWRTTRFGEYGDMRMARGRRFKLLRYRRGEGDLLFDLRRDPGETVNLRGEGEYAAAVERLSEEMDAHFGRYEDADKSGLRIRELPRHNLTEAWRV